MKKFEMKRSESRMLADIISPVGLFLRFRDVFPNTVLLESSDYHGNENAMSYLCLDPISTFRVNESKVIIDYPDGETELKALEDTSVVDELGRYMEVFTTNDKEKGSFGLFGYMAYDAVQHFEDIDFRNRSEDKNEIPVIRYSFYRFVLSINHFKNELTLTEFQVSNAPKVAIGNKDEILNIIRRQEVPGYSFKNAGKEKTNYTDDEFLQMLQQGKDFCQQGEVFQIVLSRRYESTFTGDEFNVYRALRSINPSPYLFYFDYGSYKIFGSSPEAQIIIEDRQATIHPIAGTFKRTGSDSEDQKRALELTEDPKENSEHVMLVDLARNDLSRNGENVEVETFKEVQFYSHVIHLVSKVTAQLNDQVNSVDVIAETFPAGTLSGAPKYRAMELIDQLEGTRRGYYGGAIGFMGFNGDFNHAITIRSFLSKSNTLIFQAGAGIVAKSDVQSELEEVNNKLAALRSAIEMAENIGMDK